MTSKFSSLFAEIPFLNTPIFLIPFLLLSLIYCIVFPNDLRLQSVLAPCQSASRTSAHQLAEEAYTAVDLRVLLGVLTLPDSYERRALLRLAYKLQPPPIRAVIDVRFVLCNITKEEDATLVALEIIAHDDILVLNCTENMNDGKTFEFFSAVPRLFADEPYGYDYVGKADDDTYYRLAALADTLRGKSRRDAYHGFIWPCGEEKEKDPTVEPFMVGWGYVVSWDVAAWISSGAEELRQDAKGPEDMAFARWLSRGGRGKNVYGEGHRMYEYLDEAWMGGLNCYRHLLVPDTVVVHRLKERVLWARTLKFFNATIGLTPSKMYHLN